MAFHDMPIPLSDSRAALAGDARPALEGVARGDRSRPPAVKEAEPGAKNRQGLSSAEDRSDTSRYRQRRLIHESELSRVQFFYKESMTRRTCKYICYGAHCTGHCHRSESDVEKRGHDLTRKVCQVFDRSRAGEGKPLSNAGVNPLARATMCLADPKRLSAICSVQRS